MTKNDDQAEFLRLQLEEYVTAGLIQKELAPTCGVFY